MFAAPSTGEKKPTIYLLYGDDSFAMQKFVKEMVSKLSDDPTTVDMNFAALEGKQIRIDDLRTAAFSLPFLAARRIVRLSDPLALAKNKKAQEQLLSVLENLPDSTALILLVEAEFERKDWKGFAKTNWLHKWVLSLPKEQTYIRETALPNQHAMPGWIIEETRKQGGKILQPAAVELASHVGTNTQLASLEIDKLLTYVNLSRPIEVEDVKELVPDVAPINVFDMVDAMAEGKTNQALKLLHGLLEEQDPFSLFGMIVRQFRLLLLASDVIHAGGRKEQIAQAMGIHPFVAGKLERQGVRFTPTQLKTIYQQLLEIDENIKTSQMEARLALDLFVSELSQT